MNFFLFSNFFKYLTLDQMYYVRLINKNFNSFINGTFIRKYFKLTNKERIDFCLKHENIFNINIYIQKYGSLNKEDPLWFLNEFQKNDFLFLIFKKKDFKLLKSIIEFLDDKILSEILNNSTYKYLWDDGYNFIFELYPYLKSINSMDIDDICNNFKPSKCLDKIQRKKYKELYEHIRSISYHLSRNDKFKYNIDLIQSGCDPLFSSCEIEYTEYCPEFPTTAVISYIQSHSKNEKSFSKNILFQGPYILKKYKNHNINIHNIYFEYHYDYNYLKLKYSQSEIYEYILYSLNENQLLNIQKSFYPLVQEMIYNNKQLLNKYKKSLLLLSLSWSSYDLFNQVEDQLSFINENEFIYMTFVTSHILIKKIKQNKSLIEKLPHSSSFFNFF